MDQVSRPPLSQLLTTILLIQPVCVLPYVVVPRLYDPGLHPKFLFLAFFLIVLATIALFRRPVQVPALHKLPLWWASLALPLVLAGSLFLARVPVEGIATVARWCEVYLLFTLLAVVFAGSDHFHRVLPRITTVFLLITSLAALGQLAWVVREQGYNHGSTYWIQVSFAHRNILTHALVLAMPLALLSFLRDRGVWWLLSGTALALAAAIILLLLVRTSWLAAAISILVFGAMWWPVRKHLAPPLRKRVGRRLFLLLGIGLAAAVGGWLAFRPALAEKNLLRKQVAGFAGGSYGSQGERILYWKRCLELWRERPILGYGAGSWKMEAPGWYIGYSRKEVGKGEKYVVRAHNDYLQLLNEGGIPALLSFLLFAAFAGARALQQIRARGTIPAEEQENSPPLRALCYLLGLLNYLVISWFSFPMERPSSYLWLAIYPAALLLNGPLPRIPLQNPRAMGASALGGAVILAVLGLVWIQSDLQWRKGMEAFEAGDEKAAVEILDDQLIRRMPLDPASTPLAWHRGMARLVAGDSLAALQDFELAFLANARHPHVLNNLATLLHTRGETDRPRELFRTAVLVAPGIDEIRLNWASMEYNTGSYDSALYHLGRIPLGNHEARYPDIRDLILEAAMFRAVRRFSGTQVEEIMRCFARNETLTLRVHRGSVLCRRNFHEHLLMAAVYALMRKEKPFNLVDARTLYLRLKPLNLK